MHVRDLAYARTCVGRWTYVRWTMHVRELGDGRNLQRTEFRHMVVFHAVFSSLQEKQHADIAAR